jgi:DNA repair protein RecN (Recombination protein N)
MGCQLINRFYLEDYLSFEKVELYFQKGLIVLTGPSGAGKSVLMGSLLALFGQTDTKAGLSEILLEDLDIKNENFDIEPNDDIIIKQTTSTKTRYFLNNQTISKKSLKEFSIQFSKHLHLKDTSDFDSEKIIEFVDFLGSKQDNGYKTLLQTFEEKYSQYRELKKRLEKLLQDEQELDDLIEYTKFEIEKITSIDPKEDEYEELQSVKNKLSKKDKVEEVLNEVKPLLDNSHKISNALHILDEESTFFDEAVNEVNSIFEKFYDSLLSMDDNDIEKVLTRIEDLSFLIKKHGTIKDALEYKSQKEKELEGYENISFEKAILEKNVAKTYKEIDTLSKELSLKRKDVVKTLQTTVEKYLQYLYLDNLSIFLEDKELDSTGIDQVIFTLDNTPLDKISSGEFNRLRLALLTARSQYEIDTNGILFLDEIDANLSGKESQSIAKVLEELSKFYQIFAISHQPQLSATAKQHFLVHKDSNGISTVKELDKEQRVQEIARMISGENITQKAVEFATQLIS